MPRPRPEQQPGVHDDATGAPANPLPFSTRLRGGLPGGVSGDNPRSAGDGLRAVCRPELGDSAPAAGWFLGGRSAPRSSVPHACAARERRPKARRPGLFAGDASPGVRAELVPGAGPVACGSRRLAAERTPFAEPVIEAEGPRFRGRLLRWVFVASPTARPPEGACARDRGPSRRRRMGGFTVDRARGPSTEHGRPEVGPGARPRWPPVGRFNRVAAVADAAISRWAGREDSPHGPAGYLELGRAFGARLAPRGNVTPESGSLWPISSPAPPNQGTTVAGDVCFARPRRPPEWATGAVPCPAPRRRRPPRKPSRCGTGRARGTLVRPRGSLVRAADEEQNRAERSPWRISSTKWGLARAGWARAAWRGGGSEGIAGRFRAPCSAGFLRVRRPARLGPGGGPNEGPKARARAGSALVAGRRGPPSGGELAARLSARSVRGSRGKGWAAEARYVPPTPADRRRAGRRGAARQGFRPRGPSSGRHD